MVFYIRAAAILAILFAIDTAQGHIVPSAKISSEVEIFGDVSNGHGDSYGDNNGHGGHDVGNGDGGATAPCNCTCPAGPTGPVGPVGPVGSDGLAGSDGPVGPAANSSGGGATYIRWGRTTCPDTEGTELAYSGRTVGGHFQVPGSGANYLCLTDEPEFLEVEAGVQTQRASLYGTEYQAVPPSPAFGNILDHNVPCASCYTSARGGKIMIPGTTLCPSSWTREYYGYLMSAQQSHQRSTYECVDVDSVPIPGSAADTNGALFYFTEIGDCAGIGCPPYTNGEEVTCAVCTK